MELRWTIVPKTKVHKTISACTATLGHIANERLREFDRKIVDMTALKRELSVVIASCDGGTGAECRNIKVLAPAKPIAS